ncbi:MAG: STY0301 family protein [Burkholderiales bacterium]
MRLVILASLLLAGTVHAADWVMECPARLSTSQSTAGELPAGWTGVARTVSSIAEVAPGTSTTESTPPIAISVFDGPPADMAELVPDNPNARIVQWTFKKPRTRDIYVVCNYADTRIGLARKAPAEVGSCAIAVTAPGVVCK